LCSSETSVTAYFTTERNNPLSPQRTAIPSAYHAVSTGTTCQRREGSQAVHTAQSRQGKQFQKNGRFDSEDEGTTILRNVEN
jgi:hypothetical protein